MAKIGIDFGTTNSLIVAYNKENNKFYYFNYDKYDVTKPIPTSSTVWFHDNSIIVGSDAKDNINTYSGIEGHHFEKSIKLKLGHSHGVNIFGDIKQPCSIAAEILRFIKKVAIYDWKAEKSGVDLNSAIFTVPINFNGIQRLSLRKAAQEAGIQVTTFIHEPFAAIIGYFFTKEIGNSTNDVIAELKK